MDDAQPTSIPYGHCHCGCGQKPRISPRTSRHHGYVKGEPRRFVKGHNPRLPDPGLAPTPCECGCGHLAPLAQHTDAAKGWVRGHPLRFILGHAGRGARKPVSDVDYLLVEETGCWEWQRGIGPDGYGHAKRNGVQGGAHRYYYEQAKGPIPDGLEIDHLCRNRACVNPDHLEAVTRSVNASRARAAARGEWTPPT